MSKLTDDIAALTASVGALTTAVDLVIANGTVDTSAEAAAVEAANAVVVEQTNKLTAATPQPTV